MTKIELIEYLEKLPNDTVIKGVEISGEGYSTDKEIVPFTLDFLDYTDYERNPFIDEGDPRLKTPRILVIG